MNPKIKTVLIAGVILLPFGLVALGAWKAYELYKKGEKNGTDTTK